MRRELNVYTLVRSLQGSFASLRHILFLGDGALSVVAVFCHDVMAGFLNARRQAILYCRRDSRITIIAMAEVRKIREFSKRFENLIITHFSLFCYCLLPLQHLIWYKFLFKPCLYISFLAYKIKKSS